ncbi:MAG TPA: ABC transporter permease [Thermoanaerobaculia bacterium]|jgi:predicted permease|nr:ABC transporter permease [Thermoanaerobaculia bacterium]
MSSLLAPFRSLARELSRHPGFLLVAVFTLAVGIGANAAIFSVVNAVLIRPLPYPEPERLVAVWHTAPGLNMDLFEHSDASYVLYRGSNKVLEDLGIYWEGSVTLTGGETPERVDASGATGSVFSVLRVRPVLGRTIEAADEKPGAEKVVVISHGLWRRRFGGDPKALDATLKIDGVPTRIVGVMPPDFRFPEAGTELWLPMTIDPAKLEAGDFNYEAIGRLRPGVTPDQAARDLSALVWRIPEEFPGAQISRGMIESARLAVLVHPLRDDVVGDVQRILWVLLGSVGCILLIACANVANLLLVRAEGKQREVAVRTALGARRADVLRLFLGESVALSLVGALLGLALAAAGVRLLVSLRPQGIPRLDEIGVDGAVLAFTLGVGLLAGFLCGALAALRYGAPDLVPALKEGGRGGTAGRGRHFARQVLVVIQMALALVLLVGSGLMVKSFWHLRGVDPGFDPRGVLTVRLNLPEAEYKDAFATARFVQQLLEKVRAVPEVVSAGTVNNLPLGGGNSNSGYAFEDFPLKPDEVPPILGTRFASPGYFEAMGIPVIEGRIFERLDPAKRSEEVVVSEALARRFWPGRSALGKRLQPGFGKGKNWYTIVGVVGSVRDDGLDEKPHESIYFPVLRQRSNDEENGSDPEWVPRSFCLVVKGRVDPASLTARVRQAVWSIDPNLPLAQVHPLQEVVSLSMARTSFTMLLLVIAAAVALLLGTVGIYGVISYVVTQRTREIGVRMALGAARRDISRMVLREGAVITLVGIGIGLAGALALTRLMLALLYDVSPTDPATFAAVPVLLAAVALFASWMPARRAAAVEPLEAIRYE